MQEGDGGDATRIHDGSFDLSEVLSIIAFNCLGKMASSPRSSQTLRANSQATESTVAPPLDLSALPPIFVSATHFETDNLHELEDELAAVGAVLTYDVQEARIVLTKALHKRRITFDLRAKGLWTEEVPVTTAAADAASGEPPAKKLRLEHKESIAHDIGKSQADAIVIDDEETEPEADVEARHKSEPARQTPAVPLSSLAVRKPLPAADSRGDVVKVVKHTWFQDSREAGQPLPLDDYLLYHGHRVEKPAVNGFSQTTTIKRTDKPVTANSLPIIASSSLHDPASILARAKEDAQSSPKRDSHGRRQFATHSGAVNTDKPWAAGHGANKEYAHLLHTTTTEEESRYSSDLPEMPDWVKQGIKYACQRSTTSHAANETFISQLKKIKQARELINDEIGVRAYSTSIAALAAYPYKLNSAREVLKIPGCEVKIANLFVEWSNTGKIQAVEDLEADEEMKVLRLFYEIWGVGATTAREFYYERGWRDLDDIVEYGWSTLSRVQQIGVKYYDEFLDPIPRAEVEEIGKIIHRHAVHVRDDGIQSLIVGGYRRGKAACGDVDVIVSHPDESQTLNIINDIIASLENEGWVTHTLLLSLNNSKRNQETLPYKSHGPGPHGAHGGFDTLDKALVVWQDPSWPTKEADEKRANETGDRLRNPNIHRRVDIIIAPWRTVGSAVVGWSGGTIFQRDMRRYAKNVKGWKFDSSGIRDRVNGEVVDVEGYYEYDGNVGTGRASDMVQAERRVFEGLGLVYREPWERCTG